LLDRKNIEYFLYKKTFHQLYFCEWNEEYNRIFYHWIAMKQKEIQKVIKFFKELGGSEE